MLSTLLMLFVLGIVGIVVISVIFAILGMILSLTFGLVGFLLFKVAPILLVGYVILRIVSPKKRKKISDADRRWLEG